MSKYIVTGGAGFIGSHVADALIGRGDSVLIIDDLSTGKEENINPKAEFHQVVYPQRRQPVRTRLKGCLAASPLGIEIT